MKEPLPPCDEDFAASIGHSTSDNTTPYACLNNPDGPTVDSMDEEERFDPGLNRNTKAELRRLQRIMMSVAESDPMGSARASAARAWRDLEVLRCAKNGKPLMLSVTGKGDAPKAKEPASIAIISDVASAA